METHTFEENCTSPCQESTQIFEKLNSSRFQFFCFLIKRGKEITKHNFLIFIRIKERMKYLIGMLPNT
jgi:hypothetical protein